MNALARMRMTLSRDKADTLLLIGAAVLVLAPHTAHLPPWVSAVCGATLVWRAAVTLMGKRMPRSLLLLPLALGAMGGIYLTYSTLLGRDAGVAMLVLLVAFKMLEMHARRDLFVVVFLCFFLALTNFCYSQSFGTALLMIASIVALLTVQMTFQFTGAVPPLRRRVLMAAKMLALATPVALLLFFVFPRIQGPLWGMPGDAAGGKTGLSNTMAPGNLSSLAQSNEPAFRVKFIDPVPAQSKLYWRGVVLGDFDGRTWTQVHTPGGGAAERIDVTIRGARVRHQVTLEPSSNRWLFALDLPEQLPHLPGNRVNASAELEMAAEYPLEQRVRYDVASYPDYALQAGATLAGRERWLTLPAGFNAGTLAAGRALQASQRDPLARVLAVLRHFSSAGFSYTMEPPVLGRDSVDQFLFTTRAGFCEHYAGAFVVLMRAAGVPARVVTGYQGGEPNPVDGFVTVRQSDAHAWAEVWLAGRGWLRVDPTAAVSPSRISQPVPRARAPQDGFGLAQLGNLMDFGSDPNSWAARLRFQLGALNNGWSQWVLNYTPERQRGLLDTAGATLWHWRTLAGVAALAALLFVARAQRRRARKDPVDALYSALCEHMARLGMARASDEGPNAYAQRLAASDLPGDRKAAVARFLQLYSAYKYAPAANAPRLAATLKRLLSDSR